MPRNKSKKNAESVPVKPRSGVGAGAGAYDDYLAQDVQQDMTEAKALGVIQDKDISAWIKSTLSEHKVVMFYSWQCPYSQAAKSLLEQLGLTSQDEKTKDGVYLVDLWHMQNSGRINFSKVKTALFALGNKTNGEGKGISTVPQIWINGKLRADSSYLSRAVKENSSGTYKTPTKGQSALSFLDNVISELDALEAKKS